MNPFRRNISTLRKSYKIAAWTISNVGMVIAVSLLSMEAIIINVLGAIIGSVTSAYLAYYAIRIGSHQEMLTKCIDPRKESLVNPVEFVNMGLLEVVFSVGFLALGVALAFKAT